MDFFSRLIFIFLSCVFLSFQAGASSCFQWFRGSSDHQGSASSVCSSFNNSFNTYTPSSGTSDVPASADAVGYCDDDFVLNGEHSSSLNALTLGAVSVACSPGPCTSKAGLAVDTVVPGGARSAGVSMCGADGCSVTMADHAINIIGRCPGGTCTIQEAKYTGDSCVPPTDGTNTAQSGSCVNTSSGVVCTEQSKGKNCGTVNGDEVCVDSAAPGACVSYASGAVACVSKSDGSVPTPPSPNNGMNGVPAPPSVQVSNQSNSAVTNYYTSNVVNGSSAPVVTSGQASSSGSSGSGSSSSGGGTASGGEVCSSAPSCDGDQIQCAVLHQEWLSRCPGPTSSDELSSAVGSAASVGSDTLDVSSSDETLLGSGGGLSCPADPTFTAFGHDFTIASSSKLCSSLAAVSWAVIAVGYLIGAGIFYKAVVA